MLSTVSCVRRKSWSLCFRARPEEVSALRRIMRTHLRMWGLPHLVDAAQLCISELASNAIRHVGLHTAVRLDVSMRGTALRIELQDSDPADRAMLPAPGRTSEEPWDGESGRGLYLVEAVATRWGWFPVVDGKCIWVEIEAGVAHEQAHAGGGRVDMAEAVLAAYQYEGAVSEPGSMMNLVAMEDAAIRLVADILHWLSAHGHDPDHALDRAHGRFVAQAGSGSPACQR